MGTNSDFFNRIKELTKSNNLTIEGMLEKAFHSRNEKISRSVYNGWRSRGVYPRADQAQKIAQSLNTTVEYLITGEDAGKKEISPLRRKMLRLINTSSEDELKALKVLLDVFKEMGEELEKEEIPN